MELSNLKSVEGKVAWLLENIGILRNCSNQEFIFSYWEYFCGLKIPEYIRKTLVEPETIRRVKQKLVERDPKQYGPLNKRILDWKFLKEQKIKEYSRT